MYIFFSSWSTIISDWVNKYTYFFLLMIVIFSSQPIRPAIIPPSPITPAIRSKYLQQFHSLVDVTKTNGFMNGTQAKNILQQTGLSQTSLLQIW